MGSILELPNFIWNYFGKVINIFRMAFGREIKRLRNKQKLSAEKLAKLLGVNAERLRKWEQNDSDPKDEDTKTIESKLGMSIDQVKNLKELPKFQNVPSETLEINDGNTFMRLLKVLEQNADTISSQQKTISLLVEREKPPEIVKNA